jgi:hypothetical protein
MLEENRKRVFYGEPLPRAETADGPPPSAKREAQSLEVHAARCLVERVDRVRQFPRFERALQTIIDRQEEWAHGMDLAGALAAIACLAVSTTRGRRESWQKLWTLETGKMWKALKEFPKRLQKMAEEVERVNASFFFSPAQFANAKTLEAEIARKRFNQLPGIMRVYAAALGAHVARVPRLHAISFPPPPRGPSRRLLYLSYTVRLLTGKYRDGQVAELLNAAATALDEKSQFDALTIAQARSRWKKKT